MSVKATLKALRRTAEISFATIGDSLRGTLSAERTDARLGAWGSALFADAGAEVVVSGPGLEAARSERPFVVMSNHQSLYDVPALFVALPGRMRMIAKAELFRIPIWGAAMHEAGMIRVHRTDRKRAVESLAEAAERLQQGTRIWIAPEGTRSKDGSLRPFKKGGFYLALGTKTAILPVAIEGTRRLLPAGASVVREGAKVRVHVGAPIEPEPPLEALRDRVHAAIAEALASLARADDASA